jgi:hypothetical protein
MHSELLHDIAGFFLIFSAVLMTAGIIRPYTVLWWTKNRTRAKVLMVYGSIAFLSGILFLVTIDPGDDTRKDETQQDGNNL